MLVSYCWWRRSRTKSPAPPTKTRLLLRLSMHVFRSGARQDAWTLHSLYTLLLPSHFSGSIDLNDEQSKPSTRYRSTEYNNPSTISNLFYQSDLPYQNLHRSTFISCTWCQTSAYSQIKRPQKCNSCHGPLNPTSSCPDTMHSQTMPRLFRTQTRPPFLHAVPIRYLPNPIPWFDPAACRF
jgi:hypothetical protein